MPGCPGVLSWVCLLRWFWFYHVLPPWKIAPLAQWLQMDLCMASWQGGGGGRRAMFIFSDKNKLGCLQFGWNAWFCIAMGCRDGGHWAASSLISLTAALWSGSWLGEGMKSPGTNNGMPYIISAMKQSKSSLGVVLVPRRTHGKVWNQSGVSRLPSRLPSSSGGNVPWGRWIEGDRQWCDVGWCLDHWPWHPKGGI